jgi:hypothetical protein
MKTTLLWAACGGVLLAGQITLTSADTNSADAELTQQLAEARQALLDAQALAEQIVAEARQEAEVVKRQLAVLQTSDQDALSVQNGKVNIELQAGTVEEIAKAVMPINWRVMVDVTDSKILQRRFQFISSKPREQVLNDLLRPLGLQHHYFFDLVDDQGKHSPLLVISQRS